jgi:hypothetical protein
MKNIIKISSGILLALTMIFTACKKEEVFPPYVEKDYGSLGDTTLHIKTDSIFPPAGDFESWTFFNAKTLTVIKENEGNSDLPSTADVIFAYSYNNDPAFGAQLSNTYAYSLTPLTGWTRTATIFRKNVPASDFDNALYKRAIINGWNNATALPEAESGYIAALAEGQVYAFKTQAEKHGLIKIIKIVPGQNPYTNYLKFQVRMEK